VTPAPAAAAIVALFAITGAWFVLRTVLDHDRRERVFDLSHVLMSAVMITMPFSWSVHIPAAAQILTFSAAALWFVQLAMFHPSAVQPVTPLARARHHSGRPRLLYHAAMMGAMVWMAVIMAPVPGAGAMEMSMPMGMHDHPSGTAGASPTLPTDLHPWATPISIMIGIGFAAATVWYSGRFVALAGSRRFSEPVQARRLTDFGSAALMAAGMSLTNLVVMR
jgi:hypothetical protein